jgi:hypothetical protein
MFEEAAAIVAVLLIIPGWAIALVGILAYLRRRFYRSKK